MQKGYSPAQPSMDLSKAAVTPDPFETAVSPRSLSQVMAMEAACSYIYFLQLQGCSLEGHGGGVMRSTMSLDRSFTKVVASQPVDAGIVSCTKTLSVC